MRIPVYQSQVGIQNANGGRSADYQHPSAFASARDNRLPHDLDQLAKGLGALGGTMHKVGIERRDEIMSLDLLKTVQDRQAEMSTFMDNYMQENQGRDAVGADTAFAEFGQKIMDEEMARWQGNARAQHFLQAQLGRLVGRGVDAMREYGNGQLDIYRDGQTKTQLARAKQVWGNLNSSEEEREEALSTWGKMHAYNNTKKGIPAEQTQFEIDSVYQSLNASRLENSFFQHLDNNDVEAAERDLNAMKSGNPSAIAAQFESGGLGSKAIGYDSNGGTSYGTYQISSKQGTMNDFIGWLDKKGHSKAAQALLQAGPADTGSVDGKFADVWEDLVSEGLITHDMEQAFIEESHVKPALESLSSPLQKAIQADPDLQRALFSTAVQHGAGGATKLFSRSWEKANGDKAAFVDALYAARKGQFASSDEATRNAVHKRLDRERALLGVAVVGPEKIMKYREKLDNAIADKAFNIVADLSPEEAFQKIEKMNLLPHQKSKALGVYKTFFSHKVDLEKKQREHYETNLMTDAVNMALGVGGEEANPLEARKMIMESSLDGKSKLECIKSLEDGTMGKRDDPEFLAPLMLRIARNDPNDPVDESEILIGVGKGKLTFETKDKLMKLKDDASGPQQTIIKNAFKALDSAFAKSLFAAGTPEQAAAHYAAQVELLGVIEVAKKNGTLYDILDPESKNFVLPSIMVRNQLSMEDAIQSMVKRMQAGSGDTKGNSKINYVKDDNGEMRRETPQEFFDRRFKQGEE